MCIHTDAEYINADIQKGEILEKPKNLCISKYVFQNSRTNSKLMSQKRSSKFEMLDFPISRTDKGKNLPRQSVWYCINLTKRYLAYVCSLIRCSDPE